MYSMEFLVDVVRYAKSRIILLKYLQQNVIDFAWIFFTNIVHDYSPIVKNLYCMLGVHAVESRSEEHTSELQSRFDLVCRLLLEKKRTWKYQRGAAQKITEAEAVDVAAVAVPCRPSWGSNHAVPLAVTRMPHKYLYATAEYSIMQ